MKAPTFTDNDLALRNLLAALADDCFGDRKMTWRRGYLDIIPGRKVLVGKLLEPGQFQSETPALKVVIRRLFSASYRLEVMYRGNWLVDPETTKLHPINSAQVRCLWPCVEHGIDSETFTPDLKADKRLPELAKKLASAPGL